jgi:Domain of unknown function (DUF6306)
MKMRIPSIDEPAEPDEADEGAVPEFSSPACSMHEAGDVYMGYAGQDEVTTFLNELLEAERAGARITLELRKLREMLPRVRNHRLHADLSAMLRSHEANIALADNTGGQSSRGVRL